MLRSCARKERGDLYVCASCRHKLFATSRQLRVRRFSSLAWTQPSHKLDQAGSFRLPVSCGDRHFSKSAASYNNDGQGPKPNGFRGFPGAAGGGGFGAFANRVRDSQGSSSTDSRLLPHEIEARKRSASATPPVTGPRQSPSHSPRPAWSRSNENRAVDEEQRRKSQSVLMDVFKAAREPTTPPTPRSWSDGGEEPTQRDAASSFWRTEGPSGGSKRGLKFPRETSNASNGRARAPDTDEQPGSGPASGLSAFDKMESQRVHDGGKVKGKRRNAAQTPQSTDFWTELESRVAQQKASRPTPPRPKPETASDSRSTTGKTTSPEYAIDYGTSERSTARGERSTSERRMTRFEREAKSSEDHRSNRNASKGANRRGYRSDEDYDDWNPGAVDRRSKREQQKAEKQRAKERGSQPQGPVPIFLPEYITVSSLAEGLKRRPKEFLLELEEMGFEDITVDTLMTGETAGLIAQEYGFEPTIDDGSKRDLAPRPVPEDVSTLPSRPPVVTIMGHVDHGKTTLLDWLRKSSVAAQEHGGITQHIGAFVVNMSTGKSITFLDTPGHAAFLSMRQRGANATDIVVLVVAADDSVMPQTLEALKHARSAKVPIIVAINKIDKEAARVDQVKADLSRHGIEIEDYGGDVQVVCVSGKTGQGMEDLEESIITLSEVLDVRAEIDGAAEGYVLESSVKQDGKAATILVKRGTLRVGDLIVAGRTWARIRVLRNEAGVDLDEAPPGTPAEVLGWRDLPSAGEQILQAPDEDSARTAVEYRQEMADRQQSSVQLAEQERRQREKVAAEEAEAARQAALEKGIDVEAEEETPSLITQNFIVRADVAGSVEAVCGSILELGNNEIQPKILRSVAGSVSESDVSHAAASNSVILNFNTPILPHIKSRAQEAGVKILDHSVIYHVVDDVKEVLAERLPKNIIQKVTGEADVLQIFPINVAKKIIKNIAGCRVRNGAVKKVSLVRVVRKGQVIHTGKIDTLKHVKKDVQEMGKGTECGIGLEGFDDFKVDDQIQTFDEIEEKRTL